MPDKTPRCADRVGVFLLPRRFGLDTGVLGAIIAWTIAGSGMLMLAFVSQWLATRNPDLDAGIFAYANGVLALVTGAIAI